MNAIIDFTFPSLTDINYKMKLITSTDDWVEDCNPNPCQHGGKCISSGNKQICQCIGHYTGRFCGLTMCEFEPCVFGQCELTGNGFKVLNSINKLLKYLHINYLSLCMCINSVIVSRAIWA